MSEIEKTIERAVAKAVEVSRRLGPAPAKARLCLPPMRMTACVTPAQLAALAPLLAAPDDPEPSLKALLDVIGMDLQVIP